MTLGDIASKLGLVFSCVSGESDRAVVGGYASDLLSDVLANGAEGDLWVTLQRHQNIVAVASMKGMAGIVIVNGREPEDNTREKAEAENVPILMSKMSAFELIGKLYELGVAGKTDVDGV